MRAAALGVAAATAVVAAVGVAAVSARAEAGDDRRPTTVVLTIRHSRFEPAVVTVRQGATVRFVVRNTDPIDHELIVGDESVQQAHERGTDALHRGPGAVSVAPRSEDSTDYTFGGAGSVPFACHLPGHWAYGMAGVVRVVNS